MPHLWVKVQDADLARVHDTPNGIKAGTVVVTLVFSVLHKFAGQDVGFKLGPANEMVVYPVYLRILSRPAGVWQKQVASR